MFTTETAPGPRPLRPWSRQRREGAVFVWVCHADATPHRRGLALPGPRTPTRSKAVLSLASEPTLRRAVLKGACPSRKPHPAMKPPSNGPHSGARPTLGRRDGTRQTDGRALGQPDSRHSAELPPANAGTEHRFTTPLGCSSDAGHRDRPWRRPRPAPAGRPSVESASCAPATGVPWPRDSSQGIRSEDGADAFR